MESPVQAASTARDYLTNNKKVSSLETGGEAVNTVTTTQLIQRTILSEHTSRKVLSFICGCNRGQNIRDYPQSAVYINEALIVR